MEIPVGSYIKAYMFVTNYCTVRGTPECEHCPDWGGGEITCICVRPKLQGVSFQGSTIIPTYMLLYSQDAWRGGLHAQLPPRIGVGRCSDLGGATFF